MAEGDGIDLYADVDDFGQHTADHGADEGESDLYDAMVTTSAENINEDKADVVITKSEPTQEQRCPLYIGNLTWWTSDQDLVDVINGSGVNDVVEIKFHENKLNGQSRGFATVVVGSESSSQMLMTKLPKKSVHGKPIMVTHYTKQNLRMFENAAPNKRPAANGDDHRGQHHAGDASSPPYAPSTSHRIAQQASAPPNYAPYSSQGLPPSNLQPSPAGPPGVTRLPTSVYGPPASHMQPPTAVMMPGGPAMVIRGPPSVPGINTSPEMQSYPHHRPNWSMGSVYLVPGASQPSAGAPPPFPMSSSRYPMGYMGSNDWSSDRYRKSSYHPGPYQRRENTAPRMSEKEFDEILQKNKSICNGAIARAFEDSAAGDFPRAIETLVTAISLIRQSKVSDDDQCKIFITSLQDTLQNIEQKSYEKKVVHRHHRRSGSRDSDGLDSPTGSESRRQSRSRSRHRSRSREDKRYRDRGDHKEHERSSGHRNSQSRV